MSGPVIVHLAAPTPTLYSFVYLLTVSTEDWRVSDAGTHFLHVL